MRLLSYLTSCWGFTENRDKMTTQLILLPTRVRFTIYERFQRNIRHDSCYECCDWLSLFHTFGTTSRQVRKCREKTPVTGNLKRSGVSSRTGAPTPVYNNWSNLSQKLHKKLKKFDQKEASLAPPPRNRQQIYVELFNHFGSVSQNLIQMCAKFHYRPPTKLREGNIFTGVCLSMRRGRVSLVSGPLWGVGYVWPHVLSGPMSFWRGAG